MIVIVPIVFGAPTMLVFVPPPMAGVPAVLPRFVQFMPPTLGLLATITMVLDSFVQPVLRVRNTSLAFIGGKRWVPTEH